MKTTDKTPKPGGEQPDTLIDTSKMSAAERAALEMTEAAREKAGDRKTLAGSLFLGSPDFSLITPFPAQSDEDRDQGDAFLSQLKTFLEEKVDPDEIDATGEIPDEVFEGLAKLGAFGIKIPTRSKGLGLSQTNYSRSAMVLGGYCGNLAALVSAHQSIGVPQPLILFGTEAQKEEFLPRCAQGEVSAFALTEQDVGSDPAKMTTTATLTEDGETYLLNGEKLWCTNGLKAGILVVMARTSPPEDKRVKTTAFVVNVDTPGLKFTHRCRFMGLKALYNGVVTFENVRVPKENIILAEGKGLKVALTTLNTGRLTLPAACAGLSRACLKISTDWAARRVQWGAPIGKHAAIADKIAHMAADTFATESMVFYTSALVDRDKKADIRIEAAMGKLFGSEAGCKIVDDTMQIRGGRGYETAHSLANRGEEPIAVERYQRDVRINTIFEGSSEIMRLFIAREALDPHLKIGAAALNTTLPMKARLQAFVKAGLFYSVWYPKQWLPVLPFGDFGGMHPALAKELRGVRRASKKLARRLFHAMILFGPKLEKQQLLLGRFVDIGKELFAVTATCAHADHLMKNGGKRSSINGGQRSVVAEASSVSGEYDKKELLKLATFFSAGAFSRIDHLFRDIGKNNDKKSYSLAKTLLGFDKKS